MSKAPDSRLLIKHMPNCGACRCVREKAWTTPWTLEKAVFLNAWGTRNGNYSWLMFRCNTSACPAQMVVKEDSLLERYSDGYFLQERKAKP